MTTGQIKHMVDRFLQWKLPENFNPDGGISFRKICNEHTPYPSKHEPVGTNLLDAGQAEGMVRYIVEGLQSDWTAVIVRYRASHKECKDLTGHPDALPSQRKDWRCEVCKEADSYCQPLPTPMQAGIEKFLRDKR